MKTIYDLSDKKMFPTKRINFEKSSKKFPVNEFYISDSFEVKVITNQKSKIAYSESFVGQFILFLKIPPFPPPLINLRFYRKLLKVNESFSWSFDSLELI